MKILIGQKIGMTQFWDEKGRLVAATVIKATPNAVLKEGAETVVVAPAAGKSAKPQAKLAQQIKSKNVIVRRAAGLEIEAKTVDVSQFTAGEVVSITGITKGKGFSGVMKRHGFSGWPASHGHPHQRRPGSIGAQRPQRVPKGQRMAGRAGGQRLTVRGNRVLAANTEENLLIVSGAVPGNRRSPVVIRSATKDNNG